MDTENLFKVLNGLSNNIISILTEKGEIKKIPAGQIILDTGQYIRLLPIVISGLIKVTGFFGEKQLLLYYIRPGETCIMSFIAALRNSPSIIRAQTEEYTEALFIPAQSLISLSREYFQITEFLFMQFYGRYMNFLDSINHILFKRMDIRLYDYLKEKARLSGNLIKMTHAQIAEDLATSREVITRALKKLSVEGKIVQHPNYIEVL